MINASAQEPELQDYTPQIAPPSPSAFEFATYGNIPLNGSSGGFSYNVPLYTIQQNDISMPISVNYFSNGVRIDELSGIIGADWNLNAGGVITRVMRGLPDDRAPVRWYPAQPVDLESPLVIGRIWGTADGASNDAEPDWFSFNVNGISGSFYFDENLVPHVNSDNYVKIEFTIHTEGTTYGKHSTFTITDSNGYKYIFGGNEDYLEGNRSSRDCFVGPDDTYYSTWYLREIISPTNNKIYFSYDENNFMYYTNASYNLTYLQQCYQPPYTFEYHYSDCRYFNDMKSRVLSNIQFENGNVEFTYNSDRLDGGGKSLKEMKVFANNNPNPLKTISFSYNESHGRGGILDWKLTGTTSLEYRTFLKDITIKDETVSPEQKYTFEYYEEDELPSRLSFSKDKFGFNNGASNDHPFSNKLATIFPIWNYMQQFGGASFATANQEVNPQEVYYGMLKKIIYPTKGYTVINYEANSSIEYVESEDTEIEYLNIDKGCENIHVDPVEFVFTSNGTPINFTAFANLDPYYPGDCEIQPDSLHDNYYIEVFKDNILILTLSADYGNTISSNPSKQCLGSWVGQYDDEPICTQEGSIYKIIFKINSIFGPAYGRMTVHYNKSTEIIEKPIYGAGARVKEIADYTDGMEFNKRKFFYNKLSEYPSNKTTMSYAYEPTYYETGDFWLYCPNPFDEDETSYYPNSPKFTINSSSITSQFVSRNSSTNYTIITEIRENQDENMGAIERHYSIIQDHSPNHILGHPIFGTPLANNSSNFYYDKVKEEIYYNAENQPVGKKTYQYKLLEDGMLPGFLARKNFDYPPGAYLPYNWELLNYSASYYHNFFGVIKLEEIDEESFLSNGDLQKITNYIYGDSPYFGLTTQTTTNSNGEKHITKYEYPPDLIGVEQGPYMQDLTDANRIAEPVITETKLKIGANTEKTSEKHIKYGNSSSTGNLLLPTEIHTKKGSGDINIASVEDRKITYTKYDTNGNLLEYKLENGTPVSIIWGYNKQYPIAKVEGALYTGLSAYITALQSASDNGTLTMNDFDDLREDLSSDLVTTYIYKPLIGVTDIVYPNGSAEYYEYDEFGRLKQVKNTQGEVIKKMEYHYKD